MSQWLCQRCQAGVSHNQDCCLCLLRGGALKPTDGGRWAHLVCAVTIPDVDLGDLQNKEPVVTENITRARRKLVMSIVIFFVRVIFTCFALYDYRGAHCAFQCQKRSQCEGMVCAFSVCIQNAVLQCMLLVLSIMDYLMQHFILDLLDFTVPSMWYNCIHA